MSPNLHVANEYDLADHLVNTLIKNKKFVDILANAFDYHIGFLDSQVKKIDEIAATGIVPQTAAAPRYFFDAHPELVESIQAQLKELNGGDEIPWPQCRQKILDILIEAQLKKEGVSDPNTEDSQKRARAWTVIHQIFDYSKFQLLCLLKQIQQNAVDKELVENLKQATNSRIIDIALADKAGIHYEDILRVSELMGDIDVVHANTETLRHLLRKEQPDVDENLIDQKIRSDIARIGKENNEGRLEYDGAIKKMSDAEKGGGGTVLKFR